MDGGMWLGVFAIIGIFFFLVLAGWSKDLPRRNRGALYSGTIHAGSPTGLRFEGGRIIDEKGNELKTRPMKEWIEENK